MRITVLSGSFTPRLQAYRGEEYYNTRVIEPVDKIVHWFVQTQVSIKKSKSNFLTNLINKSVRPRRVIAREDPGHHVVVALTNVFMFLEKFKPGCKTNGHALGFFYNNSGLENPASGVFVDLSLVEKFLICNDSEQKHEHFKKFIHTLLHELTHLKQYFYGTLTSDTLQKVTHACDLPAWFDRYKALPNEQEAEQLAFEVLKNYEETGIGPIADMWALLTS